MNNSEAEELPKALKWLSWAICRTDAIKSQTLEIVDMLKPYAKTKTIRQEVKTLEKTARKAEQYAADMVALLYSLDKYKGKELTAQELKDVSTRLEIWKSYGMSGMEALQDMEAIQWEAWGKELERSRNRRSFGC